jgi:hypothetical protein
MPLHVLSETHRRGVLSAEAATALVGLMVQLARFVTYGRGANQHGWHSVLPRAALVSAVRTALGEPIGGAPGGEVVDFRIGAGSGAGAAVASSVVGLAALAVTGFGWVCTSSGTRLDTLRVMTHDLPGGAATSSFYLLGTGGGQWEPLYMHWWRAVDSVNQALFRLEARYLLDRAMYGPDIPPDALLSIPRSIFEDTVTPFVGRVDLAPFFPA